MNLYEKVILDFETTGLSHNYDEILQVSAIDQDGNILINEYCKPKNICEWKEAEEIHNITSSMVKDKKPFEDYVEVLTDILTNADEIIIYNADFEVGFLKKYGVEFNNNIYDLMYVFAEVYGQWNEYYGNYTWKSLNDCCLYYGYYLSNAHDSLEDCKATLYCYNKVINNEGRYDGSEYIGNSVKEFLNKALVKVDNSSITLRIYPIGAKRKNWYFYGEIKTYDDVKYQELLNSKIHEISYTSPRYLSIYVDKFLQGDYDLLQKEVEKLKEKNSELAKENDELRNARYENYRLYREESEKVVKLEKRINKMKEKLGLVVKEEKKIPMYNSYGFYTAEYCRTTRKPMIQQSEYFAFKDVLLSKTRCKEIKKPVREGEEIYAFLRAMHGYCALYYRNIKDGIEDDKN